MWGGLWFCAEHGNRRQHVWPDLPVEEETKVLFDTGTFAIGTSSKVPNWLCFITTRDPESSLVWLPITEVESLRTAMGEWIESRLSKEDL